MKLKKIIIILGVSSVAFFTVNSSISSFGTILKQDTKSARGQNNWTFKQVSSGLGIKETITATAQDNLGNIWVGTKTGLYISKDNGKTYSSFQTKTLGTFQITKIFIDTQSTVWLGTNTKGVYKKPSNATTFTAIFKGIPEAGLIRTNSIYQIDDWIYVCTPKGLYWIALAGERFLTTFFGADYNILNIVKDDTGRIFVSTTKDNKIWVSDDKSPNINTFVKLNLNFNIAVSYMYKNSDNPDAVWIASIGNNKIDNLISTKTNSKINSSELVSKTGSVKNISLFVNSTNNIYVGTDRGLYVGSGGADGVVGTVSATSSFNTSYDVDSIYENSTGSMFVGTDSNGLWMGTPIIKKSTNLGAIIGGTIGGVVFVALLITTVLYLKKRNSGLNKKTPSKSIPKK